MKKAQYQYTLSRPVDGENDDMSYDSIYIWPKYEKNNIYVHLLLQWILGF